MVVSAHPSGRVPVCGAHVGASLLEAAACDRDFALFVPGVPSYLLLSYPLLAAIVMPVEASTNIAARSSMGSRSMAVKGDLSLFMVEDRWRIA